MDENAPATKADLAALKTELAALEERLKGHVEHIETRLLTAFHGWATSAEIKLRSGRENTTFLEQRLEIVEQRLTRIELGGNGPLKRP